MAVFFFPREGCRKDFLQIFLPFFSDRRIVRDVQGLSVTSRPHWPMELNTQGPWSLFLLAYSKAKYPVTPSKANPNKNMGHERGLLRATRPGTSHTVLRHLVESRAALSSDDESTLSARRTCTCPHVQNGFYTSPTIFPNVGSVLRKEIALFLGSMVRIPTYFLGFRRKNFLGKPKKKDPLFRRSA